MSKEHKGTMKVAVVGATGKTGGTLASRMLDRGHQVRALVRDPGRAQHLAERGAEISVFDLSDEEQNALTKITDKDEVMVGKFAMVSGSVGILDVEKQGQSIPGDDDLHTMYVPPKKKSSPEKKKPSSALGRFTKKLFRK